MNRLAAGHHGRGGGVCFAAVSRPLSCRVPAARRAPVPVHEQSRRAWSGSSRGQFHATDQQRNSGRVSRCRPLVSSLSSLSRCRLFLRQTFLSSCLFRGDFDPVAVAKSGGASGNYHRQSRSVLFGIRLALTTISHAQSSEPRRCAARRGHSELTQRSQLRETRLFARNAG